MLLGWYMLSTYPLRTYLVQTYSNEKIQFVVLKVAVIFLPSITFKVKAMETTSVTSKGQVTIPLKIRQRLGIRKGSRVTFVMSGNHVELLVSKTPEIVDSSGFGMLKSKRKAVPVDFDVASLLSKQ
jgi:AbrB family looped-hinge helix DNA binding protein